MNSQDSNDWKTMVMLFGGVLGAIVGVVATRLYVQANEAALERSRRRGPQGLKLTPMTILPIAFGVIGLFRQIGELVEGNRR